MTIVKTSELTGAALDWAVAKCEGHEIDSLIGGAVWYWLKCSLTGALEVVKVFNPSANWAQGGLIIEREKIRLDTTWNCEDGYWSARMDTVGGWWLGDTPLIAAMRCYLVSQFGETVDIPEELAK